MDALILTLAVSLALAAAAVGLLVWTIAQGTIDHGERLALAPLRDDETDSGDAKPALEASTRNQHEPTDKELRLGNPAHRL